MTNVAFLTINAACLKMHIACARARVRVFVCEPAHCNERTNISRGPCGTSDSYDFFAAIRDMVLQT
jgi:hypothetical protein